MLGKSPSITVLIPTYNRAQYITACLDSILAQTLVPTQIIVVNDGLNRPDSRGAETLHA